MNTQENNKLIAEFMGITPNEEGVYRISKHEGYSECHLSYHKEWNWLMPVVDKIESIDEDGFSYSIQVEYHSVVIWKHSDRFDSKRIIEVNGESKRSTTYNAVVEFINQFNK